MRKWRDIFLSLLVRACDTVESVKCKIVNGMLELFGRLDNTAATGIEREKQVGVYLSRLDPAERKRQGRERREALREERRRRRKRWCHRPQPCFA
jgi:hypothetical protein